MMSFYFCHGLMGRRVFFGWVLGRKVIYMDGAWGMRKIHHILSSITLEELHVVKILDFTIAFT